MDRPASGRPPSEALGGERRPRCPARSVRCPRRPRAAAPAGRRCGWRAAPAASFRVPRCWPCRSAGAVSRRRVASADAASAEAGSSAPFGVPVEPEVATTSAVGSCRVVLPVGQRRAGAERLRASRAVSASSSAGTGSSAGPVPASAACKAGMSRQHPHRRSGPAAAAEVLDIERLSTPRGRARNPRAASAGTSPGPRPPRRCRRPAGSPRRRTIAGRPCRRRPD